MADEHFAKINAFVKGRHTYTYIAGFQSRDTFDTWRSTLTQSTLNIHYRYQAYVCLKVYPMNFGNCTCHYLFPTHRIG